MTNVPITKEEIICIERRLGVRGWTKSALATVGLEFPLEKGWKERLVRYGVPENCAWARAKIEMGWKRVPHSNAKPSVQTTVLAEIEELRARNRSMEGRITELERRLDRSESCAAGRVVWED